MSRCCLCCDFIAALAWSMFVAFGRDMDVLDGYNSDGDG